ncbi:MAG: scramblase, partial [Acidimicrobiales bacterium]|nr:scramblase [Acidimicrobiales bacterium]
NWRAWNFSIRDAQEEEIARITKTFAGIARAVFTTADNYVVQIHRPITGPLQALVVAAAVSVDTALKQDNRGLN